MTVSFIHLFSALLILYSNKRIILSQSCTFSNCFECVSCSATDYSLSSCSCAWTNNQCIYNISQNIDITKDIYDKCQDTISLELQKKYCGEKILANTNKKVVIKPNKVNGKYSFAHLFCEYLFVAKNIEKKNEYEIKVERESFSYEDAFINFRVLHINNSYSNYNYFLYLSESKKEINNVKEIYAHVYFYKELSGKPFKITIQKSSHIGLYITMALVLLIGVLLIIIIILCIKNCCTKDLSFEEELRNMITEAERQLQDRVSAMQGEERNEYNEQEQLIEDHKKKINTLFQTSLKPKIYTKKIDINKVENCTICLNKFKPKKSKVSITSCNHIFHFKCLHKWLYENLISPKCPNCNHLLLENFDNNMKKISDLHENSNNPTSDNRINILPTVNAHTNERIQISQETISSNMHLRNENGIAVISRSSKRVTSSEINNGNASEESSSNKN